MKIPDQDKLAIVYENLDIIQDHLNNPDLTNHQKVLKIGAAVGRVDSIRKFWEEDEHEG